MLLRSILNKVKLLPEFRSKEGYLFFNQINLKDSIIYSFLDYEKVTDKINDGTFPLKINFTVKDKEAYSFTEDRLIYIKFHKDNEVYFQYYNTKLINENLLKVISFRIDKDKYVVPLFIFEVPLDTLIPEITIKSDLIPNSSVDESFNSAIHVILLLNFLLKTYNSQEKTISTHEQRKSNIKKSDLSLYNEYVLDLSSPKINYKSLPLGGTHESPREHYRREHTRHYKSGKIAHVKGCTINKGSSKGKIVKEYNII